MNPRNPLTRRLFLVATPTILALATPKPGMACDSRTAPLMPPPGTRDQIDYHGFRNLTQEVEAYRAGRLVPLARFQQMAAEPNTLILDARSADAYRQGHIDGAVNLAFSDFTAQSLDHTLGPKATRVLIYCNNNFQNNAPPVMMKSVRLALNIQTFINLYGYGFRNVYELGDVVNFDDPHVHWVRG